MLALQTRLAFQASSRHSQIKECLSNRRTQLTQAPAHRCRQRSR